MKTFKSYSSARLGSYMSGKKCPNCLTLDPLFVVRGPLPWFFWPLRPFLRRVKCRSCLRSFAQIKYFGWLLPL